MSPLLEGIKILDLTKNLPGPFATQWLADLGAKVLKIEDPNKSDLTRLLPPFIDNTGIFYLALNRNKQSMTLNLKTAEAKMIFYQLIEHYDVIIEGFRPGVVQRLGVDYESIKLVQPEIIYCSLSGYGQTGPYNQKTGHDLNYFAEAGYFEDILKKKNSVPFPLPVVPIGDISGAMTAIIGILSAIIHRNRTGSGQFIDISIFDSLVSWLNGSLESLISLNPEGTENQLSNNYAPLSGRTPYYTTYETKDKQFISIGAIEPHFWQSICEAINRPNYISQQFEIDEYPVILSDLRNLFLEKNLDEWLNLLPNACVAPVVKFKDIMHNEQLKSRKMFPNIPLNGNKEFKGIDFPIKFSKIKRPNQNPPPELGAHTNTILQQLGYNEKEIDDLKKKNVI
ncbi:MAG: CaiB/BaiF CoA transferase family protein [Candidatus Hodarchaeales archaeon]|jgi:crotonobetainyl-CoA:carnitine CoA-transferase CaiB-like acyl-CoA transferase